MSEAKRRGLGRGLDALLGDQSGSAAAEKPPESVTMPGFVPVSQLRPNRHQPRRVFDDEGIEELARSVRQQGMIQPIVVSAEPDGGYAIVAGERRWRAAQRAGLTEVPVVIRQIDNERQRLELALVENLQRTDLGPLEEAEAYESLRREFGLPQDEIAERVGKARTTITNALRLLRFPEEVKELLRGGALTAGQARPLLGVGPVSRQIELARLAAREGLSARAIERLAAAEQPRRKPRPAQNADVHTRAAQERLIHALQTKVDIRRRGGRGQVVIHFHSEEELMRIYERLVGPGGGAQ